MREDLAFRWLAWGVEPDFREQNDVFTQAVEMARRLGMGKLGTQPLAQRG